MTEWLNYTLLASGVILGTCAIIIVIYFGSGPHRRNHP